MSLGLGLNSSIVFSKGKAITPDSGKGGLEGAHVQYVLLSLNQLPPTLQALKSLFTLERHEILLSLRSAAL